MDLGLSTPTTPTLTPKAELEGLEAALKSGANWFYWIAALSVVNSVIQVLDLDWSFVLGLGFTQIVDLIAKGVAEGAGGGGAGTVIKVVAFVFDLVVAGVFALFGWLGGRRHGWALIVGMILYSLDAVIFILAQSWMGLVFHGVALYYIWTGFSNLRTLKAREQELGLAPIG